MAYNGAVVIKRLETTTNESNRFLYEFQENHCTDLFRQCEQSADPVIIIYHKNKLKPLWQISGTVYNSLAGSEKIRNSERSTVARSKFNFRLPPPTPTKTVKARK